jgi:hypothetical protein
VNKLKLDLDELAVESFDTCGVDREKGTVLGEEQCTCPGVTCANTCPATCAHTCDDATCPQCPTCAASCNGTCDDPSCWGSCGATCWETCGRTCIDITIP